MYATMRCTNFSSSFFASSSSASVIRCLPVPDKFSESLFASLVLADLLLGYINLASCALLTIETSFKNLYKAYLLGGDYKTSADYFQQYDNIRDSLNIEEKAVNVEREKIESSFRDKEQAMELENNKKRLNLLYAIVVLLIISSVLLFLIVRYKNNLYKEKIENELVASREKGLKLELELKNKELVSK